MTKAYRTSSAKASSGQSKAPAIASDSHHRPPIKTTSQRIYSPTVGGDGCKPGLGGKKK